MLDSSLRNEIEALDEKRSSKVLFTRLKVERSKLAYNASCYESSAIIVSHAPWVKSWVRWVSSVGAHACVSFAQDCRINQPYVA